ncbi:MAG: response regulator [Magnetococcales bacterium]|nr:response regulator [Magnetococcales bacterium]
MTCSNVLPDPALLNTLSKTTSGMTLLHVDDDVAFRRQVVEQIMTPLKFARIDEAADGNTGWLKYSQRQYHLVITDFDLPGMVGTELIKRMHERNIQQNVIIMTRFDTIVSVKEMYRSSSKVQMISKTTVQDCLSGKNIRPFWEAFARSCLFAKVSTMDPAGSGRTQPT